VTDTLQTYNLSIGYGNHVVQGNLNLKAASSTMISLIGTNGTGKSTLLRSLAGLQTVVSGSVMVDGEEVSVMRPAERAKKISVVLTDVINTQHLSAFDLVAMGRLPYTSWSGKLSVLDKEIVERSIQQVGLEHKSLSMVNELSDGERQRASIARALAQDTPLILLDEPTSHLDLPNRVEIMMLLRRLADEQRKTIIISTHELNLAFEKSHEIWLLRKNVPVICEAPCDMVGNEAFVEAFTTMNFDPVSIIKH